MDVCAICGKPEDHVNHDVMEVPVYYSGAASEQMYKVGHMFQSTKDVD